MDPHIGFLLETITKDHERIMSDILELYDQINKLNGKICDFGNGITNTIKTEINDDEVYCWTLENQAIVENDSNELLIEPNEKNEKLNQVVPPEIEYQNDTLDQPAGEERSNVFSKIDISLKLMGCTSD